MTLRQLAVLLAFKVVVLRRRKKNLYHERKFIHVKERKVHALLFAHSFETKIGFGFGLASYLKTKPESALRKRPSGSSIKLKKVFSPKTIPV